MSAEIQSTQAQTPAQLASQAGRYAEEALQDRLGEHAATEEGRRKVQQARLAVSTVVANALAVADENAIRSWRTALTKANVMRLTLQLVDLDLSPVSVPPGVYVFPKGREIQTRVSPVGFKKLAARSGQIVTVDVVYDGDEFDCGQDHNGWYLRHVKARSIEMPRSERAVLAVYGVNRRATDGRIIAIREMDRAEIERARAAGSGGGPWKTWWSRMAEKTVLARMARAGEVLLDDGLEHAIAASQDDHEDETQAPSQVQQVSAPRPPSLTMSGKPATEVFDVEQTADPVSEESP